MSSYTNDLRRDPELALTEGLPGGHSTIPR